MDSFQMMEYEYQIIDRPINAFGEFVCPSNSNVKDIIRKFESKDSLGTSSSLHSPNHATPRKYSSEKVIEKRLVYEDPCQTSKHEVQVHELFPKKCATRTPDITPEKKPNLTKNKETSSNQLPPQDSFTGGNPFRRGRDNMTYPSKTTICKTDLGVRIIIEIDFDTETKLENWRDSRIETDIPYSEILDEFQRNSL